jgi:hypothetical protein
MCTLLRRMTGSRRYASYAQGAHSRYAAPHLSAQQARLLRNQVKDSYQAESPDLQGSPQQGNGNIRRGACILLEETSSLLIRD